MYLVILDNQMTDVYFRPYTKSTTSYAVDRRYYETIFIASYQ